ncbi:MAG: serine/threonine protein kinase [Candidatus Obscuribacterales bacterium]
MTDSDDRELVPGGSDTTDPMESIIEPMWTLRQRNEIGIYRTTMVEPDLRFPYDCTRVATSPAEDLGNNLLAYRLCFLSHIQPIFFIWYLISYLCLIGSLGFARGGDSLLIAVAGGSLVTMILILILAAAQVKARGSLRPAKLIMPSNISVSPTKIGINWAGKRLASLPACLPWRDIALVHLEKHRLGNEQFHMLSIRTFTGQALLVDSRCFESPTDFGLLLKSISQYARHAITNPALSLAVQKTQLWPVAYCTAWEFGERMGVFRYLPAASRNKRSKIFPELVLPAGTRLKNGRYEIEEHIKTDLRSISYRARTIDNRIEKDEDLELLGIKEDSEPVLFRDLTAVTIKQLVIARRDKNDVCDEVLPSFERAVRANTFYRHKDIVRWLDVFAEGGRVFVVFEHIAGDNLAEKMSAGGKMGIRDALKIAITICDIIESLHYQQVMMLRLEVFEARQGFGYLAPDCFVLTGKDEIKLVELPILEKLATSANLSIGVPIRYSAPETFEGVIVPRSDIYSLGCMLHYFLTGTEPEPYAVSHPSALDSDIPTHIDEIVARMTAQNLSQRYEEISDVKFALMEARALVREEIPK